MSDCPRTQLSRASSQSDLLVEMKGGNLVFLKQPISALRLVVLVVGGGEVDVRGVRVSSCAGEGVRGVAKTDGRRRENIKIRGCIFWISGRCREWKTGKHQKDMGKNNPMLIYA